MKNVSTDLAKIYNFRSINETLGTAGQPAADQFAIIRDAGFEAVINLALPTSDNALATEGSIVTSLGLSYFHIPVDFKAPTRRDFQLFCRLLDAHDSRPVFVHCAANMRVSAFVFLHRVLDQHVPIPNAQDDLHAIWQPDEVWSRFIHQQLEAKRTTTLKSNSK
jgi:protein tyrosine phosphatase (PTP) superfamily phosphohydrolase (DUF442 family)